MHALARYLFSGGMFRTGPEKVACATGSTGLCLILVVAGSLPRKWPPFQFVDGLMGLGTNPPPQLGQTFWRTCSTQAAQNVHSYVQMRASSESGGKGVLQCSQVGRSSSIVFRSGRTRLTDLQPAGLVRLIINQRTTTVPTIPG